MEPLEEVVVKVEDEMGIFVKEEESFVGDTNTSTYDEDASINPESFTEVTHAFTFDEDALTKPDFFVGVTNTSTYDEGALIKPESFLEVTNAPNYDEDASINFEDLLVENPHSSFVPIIGDTQKELLIYTKKVDDMRIWNKVYKYRDPKDILDQIIFESKPIWNGQYKKKKKRKYMIKFQKFEQRLRNFNYKVAQYRKLYKKQTAFPTINIDDDDDDVIPADGGNDDFTDDESDIITLDICSTGVDNQPSIEQTPSPRYIVKIKTLQSILCEVYFVNDKGNPTEFHKLEKHCIASVIPNSLSFTTEKVWLECCCWYSLNTRLKFIKLENCSKMFYRFIRRPHDCDPGKCLCCCKKKYDYFKKYVAPMPVHQTARNHLQNRWNQHLVHQRGQQTQNSLINAALLHKPSTKTINKKEKKSEYYRNICLKLQNVSSRSQTYVYYLGHDGLINTCYKPNNIHYTLQYLQDIMGGEHSEANDDICCLTNYKQYCQKLTKKAHTTVVKFLVNSKMNFTNKCKNCESLEIQNVGAKGVVVPLNFLPKYPRHTRVYSKLTRDRDIIANKRNMQINDIENTKIDDPINEGLPKMNIIENIQKELNINFVIPSDTSKQTTLNLIDLGIEGLKLIISPGGKVKVKSKTLLEDISTENLKILREIIHHANNKVVSLGFNPTRSINVNRLFVNNTQVKPPTEKSLNSNPARSTNVNNLFDNKTQMTSLTEKPQNKHFDKKEASPSVTLKEIENRNNSAQPVNLEKEPDQNGSNYDKNIYKALTGIKAEKRQQYLISHEFLKTADTYLWKYVNMVLNEKDKGDDTVLDNNKRKTADKGTSPPPKQQRKANSNRKNILHVIGQVPPTSSTYIPTIPIAHLPSMVPIESLQQPQTENAPMVLPENVNVLPIGQLPQNIAMNLYNNFAFMPVCLDTPQPLNVQIQSLNPKDITQLSQQSMITTSLPSLPLMPLPASVQTPIDITNVPVVEDSVPIENERDEANDDDCILGV